MDNMDQLTFICLDPGANILFHFHNVQTVGTNAVDWRHRGHLYNIPVCGNCLFTFVGNSVD